MKKIGILGGTFDPIHLAHLSLAQSALDQKGLDVVLFMPTKNPPHKQNTGVSEEALRTHLIRLAVENQPSFAFSDFELKQGGVSYTARTLKLFADKHPQDKLYFIMGGDSLFQFSSWYHPEQITQSADILVFARKETLGETKAQAKKMAERFHGTFEVLFMDQMPISSHMIREKILRGESVRTYLPQRVYEEIVEKKYYQKQGDKDE